MATLAEIEDKARHYHVCLSALDQRVNELEAEIADCKRNHLPEIRRLIGVVQEHRAALLDAVHASPEVFAKPKSRVFHRIKVGWRKAGGKVVVADEAKVVAAIKRLFPRRTGDLINVTERVDKKAVAELPGAELKKLGVQLTEDVDEAFVKPVDGEIEKLAAALVNKRAEQ